MDSYLTDYLELSKNVYLPKDIEIDGFLIKQLVERHRKNVKRYEILQSYYEGRAKILDRAKDDHKANNRLVLDYPSYIVDVLLGMFVGNPINYSTGEDDKEKMQRLQEVFDLNDEQDENTEIAKMAGIKGRGYEIVYQDENANTCFNEVQPDNVVMVYDNSIKPEPLFALYISKINDLNNFSSSDRKRVSVYTKNDIRVFEQRGGNFVEIVEEYAIHPFKEVPVIEFMNNDEGIGDFERVLPLIDAINKAQSDTANDFEEFTDAILVLYGMLNIDVDDVNQLMRDRVLSVSDAGGEKQGAEWLIKSINDTAIENYKQRLDKDIHKFAKVPNMSDEYFAGNVSGESMKYKLFATDQIISQKQRKFKTGLQKRIRLIFNVLGLKIDNNFNYRDIDITFNDNKPINELDNANLVKVLDDLGLSNQFKLSKLVGMEDVQEELRRQELEADAYSERFKSYMTENDE